MKEVISENLLNNLGFGKVTYIGEVDELYNMQCLWFKCDVTRDDSRGNGKNITFNKSFHIALEVLARELKEWASKKGYCIIDYLDSSCDNTWTVRVYKDFEFDGYEYEITYQLSSAQAIFNICEWIILTEG